MEDNNLYFCSISNSIVDVDGVDFLVDCRPARSWLRCHFAVATVSM